MKTFRFILLTVITFSLCIALNVKHDKIPPLGKFLSPFHGYLQNAEYEAKDSNENLSLIGLNDEVTVHFDELDIPHIFALNDHDLHMAQGYLTAKDRLWQMDFLSRVVMGRLSEILGEQTLNTDIYLRRIGLKKMTKDTYRITQNNSELKKLIEAYTKGVNAYINELSYADYPLEFKLLNYSPELWTEEKTHLAYALLSQTLSMGESDLENTNAIQLLGRDIFDLLYPEQTGNLQPVISANTKWDFEAIKPKNSPSTFPTLKTRVTIEKPDPLNGSNNFAISGSKSATGNVLLANEPDLNLTLPSIWHSSHLSNPNKNVMGVTVPGTPVILIGFNDSIAWGVTNSPRDQVDWYSITFRDESRSEYLYNNQWFKTSKTIEEIKVNGGETYFDTIVYTHHGPVVYDKNYKSEHQKRNYAMKWIGHFPSTTFQAINEVNKSNNYQEFTKALSFFQGPPQNFIFGSTSGDIAMWLPGKFPVKWKEQGKFLMDGANINHEWSDYIPFEHFMYMYNPARQFVSSANQHQVSSSYPYYVYDHHYEYYRGRRINDRLSTMNNVSVNDMMKLQNDNFNYHASDVLPTLLSRLDTSDERLSKSGYYQTLTNWDYFSESDNKATPVFQTWWDILYDQLWDEFDTISIAINKPNDYTTAYLIKKDSLSDFSDILSSNKKETLTDLINLSFTRTIDSLNIWSEQNGELLWANYKNTRVLHYLKLYPFSTQNINIGGYKHIVNAAAQTHGPSWRMVVELDPKGVKAWGVYPGSQTGNPGSPKYGHMINNWAEGKYFSLVFGRNLSNDPRILATQKILPK